MNILVALVQSRKTVAMHQPKGNSVGEYAINRAGKVS